MSDDPKPPLEYRNSSDDRPDRRKNVSEFLLHALIGAVVCGVFGFSAAFMTLSDSAATRPSVLPKVAVGFAAIAAFSGGAGLFILRRPNRRYWLAGFLLGISLACLIEGLCFFG